jgi:hypothetical protein
VERGQNGRILAGCVPGSAGAPVRVFMMTLTGTSVASTVSFDLGSAVNAASGVTQLADFGSFAVAAVYNLANTFPLYGARLAYLSKAPGAFVAPITVTGLSATAVINAIAKAGPPFAPDSTLYLGVNDMGASRIYSLPVPSGGAVTQFVPYPYSGIITNLSVKPTGEIYSVFNNSTGANIWVYNAVNPNFGSGGSQIAGGGLNGIATESVTYGYTVLQLGGPTGYRALAYHPVGSGPNPGFYTYTTLATATASTPASGWYTGIDWNPTPAVYGAGAPGANTYSWDLGEFSLGMPFTGSDFTLRATSTPGTAVGWFAVSLAPASLTLFGISILIDPASLVQLTPIFPGTSWISMAPYMAAALAGTTFYCQAFYFEPAAIASSDGLRFRVL